MGVYRAVLVCHPDRLSLDLTNATRFPAMFEEVGIAASAGVMVALITGVSFIPTALLHWQGWRLR